MTNKANAMGLHTREHATNHTASFKSWRMPSMVLLLAILVWLDESAISAQQINVGDDTSVPVPGSDHDYIHLLNETVNPANGTLSLRFPLPVPKGRGITLPAALTYNSDAVLMQPLLGGTYWQPEGGLVFTQLSSGNWGYAVPYATDVVGTKSIYTNTGNKPCNYSTYYMFEDASGVQHPLGLTYADQFAEGLGQIEISCGFNGSTQASGGDGAYWGYLTGAGTPYVDSGGSTPLQVTDNNGTLYYFPGIITIGSFPSYIEDRNGNKVTAQSNFNGSFAFTDDLGRTVVSSSGMGAAGTSTTFATSGFSYNIGWQSVSASGISTNLNLIDPPQQSSDDTCFLPPSTVSENAGPQVQNVTLPNGLQYKFLYDTVTGELSEIEYPNGASVTYTWTVPTVNSEQAKYDASTFDDTQGAWADSGYGCYLRYSLPVVSTRTVNNGSGPVLEQTFTYNTTWGTTPSGLSDWTSKSTTVTTTDLVLNQSYTTVYDYLPIVITPNNAGLMVSSALSTTQVPTETEIQTYDWVGAKDGYPNPPNSPPSNPPVSTVNKVLDILGRTWCEMDTMEDGVTTAGKWFNYSSGFDSPTDVKEYPYGSVNASSCNSGVAPQGFTRETSTTLTSISSPQGAGFQVPSGVVEYGNGIRVKETDYTYDQGSSLSGVSGLPSSSHDPAYSASALTGRGNLTTATSRCFPNCSDSTTEYTYDITGQVVSAIDPCGISGCSDMSGTTHTTYYSYADSSPGNAAFNSNAYLTQISYPVINGIAAQRSFTYNYTTGELSSSKDENGNITMYCYFAGGCSGSVMDPLNRLTETDYPDSGKTTISYNDSVPSVTTTILAAPDPIMIKVSIMDGMGHVTQTQLTSDLDGTDFVNTSYDGSGRVFSRTNPYRVTGLLPTTLFYYDSLGRSIKTVEEDGSILQSCYDGISSLPVVSNCSALLGVLAIPTPPATAAWVDSTDENGNHWQRASDSFGRLLQVMEPNGVSQAPTMESDYRYDMLNNLLSVTQWGGSSGFSGARSRSFTYNSLSRLVTAANPEAGTINYTYDLNGNVQTKKDARAITTQFGYDALNRVISKTYPSDTTGTVISCYQYDSSSIIGAGGNLKGRLTNAWTQATNTSCTGTAPNYAPVAGSYLALKSILAYDPMGRPASAQQRQCVGSSCSAPTPYSLTMAYDLAGNMTALTNSVGASGQPLILTNYFDAAARPCLTTSNWSGNASLSWNGNVPLNLFQANPSTSTPGYIAFGGLQNWSMGSTSSLALTGCGTAPTSKINITQGYTNRFWVNRISVSGQIP